MPETVETLAHRLDRVEKVLDTVTAQLALLVAELVPSASENGEMPDASKSSEAAGKRPKVQYADKKEATRIMNKLFERMGIADVEPMPIEELHKSMIESGLPSDGNEFSRAIIEEREK